MMYYLKIIVYLLYLNNMEHGKSSPGHHISFEILYLNLYSVTYSKYLEVKAQSIPIHQLIGSEVNVSNINYIQEDIHAVK